MSDVEKDIVELEKQYWQAIVDKDIDNILRLSANPAIVTGAQGLSAIDHDSYRQMMEHSNWELLEFELEGMQTLALTPDVVTTAYLVTENMVVDGKPLTLKAADASTWVRQGDQWVCALHTESILGDPFGRDKRANSATAFKPAARKKASGTAAKKRRPVASRRRKVKS